MSHCPVRIDRGPECGDQATYRFTAMCVHEHLHRGTVCRWHSKVLAAQAAELELLCVTCQNAGSEAEIRMRIEPLEVTA